MFVMFGVSGTLGAVGILVSARGRRRRTGDEVTTDDDAGEAEAA
jgi:hypothetical protein